MRKQQLFRNSRLVWLLVVLLSGCGYQLRQAVQLPEELKAMYVQGASGALYREIKRVVKSSDGKLVPNSEEAGMVINVLKEDMRRNVLSLSTTGKATEYELYYTLQFELRRPNGNVVVPLQTVEFSRDYFNDQSGDTVLGKASEEKIIREELYRNAVRSVVDRARSALRKQQAVQGSNAASG